MENQLGSLREYSGQNAIPGDETLCSVCKKQNPARFGFVCKFCPFSIMIAMCTNCRDNLSKGLFKPLLFLQHDQEHISVELV